MRRLLRAVVIANLAAATLVVSASAAQAPEWNATTPVPAMPADPGSAGEFPASLQTAERVLQDPEINELSGLAASRLHPGVLYGINDSGGQAVVYAIDSEGNTVARLRLPDYKARDWEAITPSIDEAGNPVLWIGDIGDNFYDRKRVRVIRIAEPLELTDRDVSWEAYPINYPDGPHDAETLVANPVDGTLSIITKGDGEPGAMYRLPQPLRDGDGENVVTRVMEVPPGVTDGAYEFAGQQEPRLVLTDYWRLHRLGQTGWVSTFGPLQLQREALAWPWLPDGQPSDLLLLGAEGTGSRIVTAQAP